MTAPCCVNLSTFVSNLDTDTSKVIKDNPKSLIGRTITTLDGLEITIRNAITFGPMTYIGYMM